MYNYHINLEEELPLVPEDAQDMVDLLTDPIVGSGHQEISGPIITIPTKKEI